MTIIFFEDEKWKDFTPISTTRHLAEQVVGPSPVFVQVSEMLHEEVSFVGRNYLREVVEERTHKPYNEAERGLAVNSRVDPVKASKALKKLNGRSGKFLLMEGEDAVAISGGAKVIESARSPEGHLSQAGLRRLLKGFERLEAGEGTLFPYPWAMVEANAEAIKSSARGAKDGLRVSKDAAVEDFVFFDTRTGPVVIEDGAEVQAFTRLEGPCYIGSGARVNSATIRRGTTVSAGSKVGGELENAIVYPHSNKAHYGYLADSIVGEWVNIGAGAVTSNLKNTYGPVRVWRGKSRVDTGLIKLGSFFGDMCKVSIGTMVYAGRSVGVGAECSGTVDSDVPDFTRLSGTGGKPERLWLESVLKTQERMKSRRGLSLTAAERGLIERLYKKR